MKRFEFNLQSLLNYRKHLEEMAQQAMARAVKDVAACETRIQSFQATHGQGAQRLEQLVEKGIGSSEFKLHHAYLGAVTSMIGEEREQKTRLDQILSEKRLFLKKSSIAKKALERLREKRAKEYTLELVLSEQKELDEISSLKTARERFNE